MKNRLLVVLIILATVFPFAATAVELLIDNNLVSVIVLGVITIIWFITIIAALVYKPRGNQSTDRETPIQVIPTLKGSAAKKEGTPQTPKPADPSRQGNKRQRAR
jgi:hypothetical protein